MRLRGRARFLLLAALSAAVLAAPAAAQDQRPQAPAAARIQVPVQSPRLDLAVACETRDGLSLCVKPKSKDKKQAPRLSEDQAAGRLNRLTRLAGMFMGRVDAASVGDFRLRFTLDLR